MNFFEHQDRARRQTRWLIFLFLIAATVIVVVVDAVVATVVINLHPETYGFVLPTASWLSANWKFMIGTSLVVVAFIALASAVRTLGLGAGGGRIAQSMGGSRIDPDTQDPLRRRLLNVVEEMAIASGVPVPEVYVLEGEAGINAFAAGLTAESAAVAVTQGCLDRLSRDELQGVIGHEFSHVLNGDMRLNVRLMGILFGILVIGMIGRTVVRSLRYSRRGKGGGAIVLAGIALFIVGYAGVFFGRVIKAAVSRQREFLADASAVQFTRQSGGLADALKKIGGYQGGSLLTSADPEEISHMLFATGARLSSLLATHPPIEARIRALDPQFRPDELAAVGRRMASERTTIDEMVHGFADEFASGEVAPIHETAVTVEEVPSAAAGRPGNRHLRFAKRLRESIPPLIDQAARTPGRAICLVFALLLSPEPAIRRRQLGLLEQRMGEAIASTTDNLSVAVQGLGAEYRLPLLTISVPIIRQRPTSHLQFLADLVLELIRIDSHVDAYEYALSRVFCTAVGVAVAPEQQRIRRPSARRLSEATGVLFSALAHHGHTDEQSARRAYDAGIQAFFGPADSSHGRASSPPYGLPGDWAQALDRALNLLAGLPDIAKGRLIDALAETVFYDRTVSVSEAELLRAVCALLGVPLPPFLSEDSNFK